MPTPSAAGSPSTGPGPLEALLAAADRALLAWEQGASLDDLLATDPPPPPALRHGLFALFRHRAAVDWLIARFAPRQPRPRLLRILRWVFTQVLFQDGVRPEAAANAAVAQVRRRYGPAEAGFLNAVLRAALAGGRAPLAALLAESAPPAVRRGLGPELEADWGAWMSPEQLERLAVVLQDEAPLTFRLRPGAPAPEPAWEAVPLDATVFWRCGCPAALLASAAFARGDLYIQDPSTRLAPQLVAARPGERIADLCAAPGGKALLLAEALGVAADPASSSPSLLLCADRSPVRLRRLRGNLDRCGVRIPVLALAADATRPPLRPGDWDAVLLDVPCSNTGVIRRRPDVRWRFTRARLADLAALQARLLDGAAPLVRPGGRLVYSTCSLEPAENRGQVQAFLERHPEFRLVQDEALFPDADHDGGYAARLERLP